MVSASQHPPPPPQRGGAASPHASFSLLQANHYISNSDELFHFPILIVKSCKWVNTYLLQSVLGSGLVHTGEGLPGWVCQHTDIWYKLCSQKHIFTPGSSRLSRSVTDIYILSQGCPQPGLYTNGHYCCKLWTESPYFAATPRDYITERKCILLLIQCFLRKKTPTLLLLHGNILLLSSIDQKPTKNASSGSRCQLIPKSALRT